MTDIAAEIVEPHAEAIYVSQGLWRLAEMIERGDQFENAKLVQILREWAQILAPTNVTEVAELPSTAAPRNPQPSQDQKIQPRRWFLRAFMPDQNIHPLRRLLQGLIAVLAFPLIILGLIVSLLLLILFIVEPFFR